MIYNVVYDFVTKKKVTKYFYCLYLFECKMFLNISISLLIFYFCINFFIFANYYVILCMYVIHPYKFNQHQAKNRNNS